MSQQQSIADMAVETLAAVSAMGKELDTNHPERHAVRGLKRVAEQAILAALHQARDLAWQAQDLTNLRRQLAADKPTTEKDQGEVK